MKMSISTEKRQKLAWIGTVVGIGLVIALVGSMVLELTIYSLADKVAQAYTQDLK